MARRQAVSAWFGALAVAWCVPAAVTSNVSPIAAAAPGTNADSLIVGLDEVRRMTDRDDLTAQPVRDAPVAETKDPHAPAACQMVYSQEDAFGKDWKRFRTAEYSAETGVVKTMAVVMQAVGLYADGKTAHAVFDRLVPALEECSELHAHFYEFTVDKPDSSTVVLNFHEFQRSVIYRVSSSALIDVIAAGFPEPDQVGGAVAQKISSRVK